MKQRTLLVIQAGVEQLVESYVQEQQLVADLRAQLDAVGAGGAVRDASAVKQRDALLRLLAAMNPTGKTT